MPALRFGFDGVMGSSSRMAGCGVPETPVRGVAAQPVRQPKSAYR